MVTIEPRWRFPVEDHEGARTQLGMNPTRDGRLAFEPPPGERFTIGTDELPQFLAQVAAHMLVIRGAQTRAEVAREVGKAQGGC